MWFKSLLAFSEERSCGVCYFLDLGRDDYYWFFVAWTSVIKSLMTVWRDDKRCKSELNHIDIQGQESNRASHLQATLSMSITTPSELVISRLAGEDWSWNCCLLNIEGQEKSFSSRGVMGARRAIVLALEGLDIHLESMSSQRLSSPGVLNDIAKFLKLWSPSAQFLHSLLLESMSE